MFFVRSKIGSVLIGVVIIAFIPVWIWLIAPVLLQLPEDFSFAAEVVSVDDFFDEERGVYSGGVFSKTNYIYETISSEGGDSLINNTFAVTAPNGDLIFSVERLYGVNRITGALEPKLGDKNREGYLFAPKNLKEGEPFTYWHINYDGPAHMTYSGRESLYGLTVYRYETRYENVPIDQTEDLLFLPEVGVSRGVVLEPYLQIWVEPLTGRLVKYADDTVAYYYDLDTKEKLHPWNHFANSFSESSVKQNVLVAKWEKTKTKTLIYYIPIILGFLALLLIGKGLGWLSVIQSQITINRTRFVIGFIVVGVAIASIVGWILGIESLVRIVPYASAMNPMTAFCFVALGIALLLKDRTSRLSVAVGLVVSLVGLIRLIDIYTGLNFSIDLLLFSESISAAELPSRMAQYTALSFLLLGLVPLLNFFRTVRKFHLPEILSSLVFFFTVLAIISFLFDSFTIVSIPVFFSAAIHTAVLFLLLSVEFYIVYSKNDEFTLSFRSWLSVSGVLLVSVMITIGFVGTVDSLLTKEANTAFKTEVLHSVKAIEGRVGIYVNALNGARGLLTSSERVDRDEWKAYVTGLDIVRNYPGIQGIGYAVFVKPEDRESHIESIRAEGFPNYTIRPEGVRDLYSTIVYIEPFNKRNQEAFGYDMFSNPVRRLAMELARDSGEAIMSGRITLVQEIDTDVQPGFLIYVPYYENDSVHNTEAERRLSIKGYSYAAFRSRDFVEGAIGVGGIANIGLRITDGFNPGTDNTIYDDGDKILAGGESRFTETVIVYVAGRPWSLTFNSANDYGQTFVSRVAVPVITLIGVLVSVLIAFLFYTLSSSRQRAIAFADKATKDLREEKAKDEAILANIGDGVVVADATGKLIFWNAAANKILGMDMESTPQDKWVDKYGIYYTDEKTPMPGEKQALALALKGEHINKMGEFIRNAAVPEGRHISVTAQPIHLEDKTFVGAVAIFRDVTHESEIDKAKTEFVSLASHQLRTPLSTINWYAEMLLAGDAGKINEEQKKYLNEIYTGNQRMVELVNALLNVSRLELGTFVVEPVLTDVVDLMKSVVKEQKPQADTRKQSLTETYSANIPNVSVDPKLLRMVFQNLLSNAIKYTPEGGKVSVKLDSDDKNLNISVADTGWGIPKEQHSKIFSKLFRADNVMEQDTEGTGLGLYIVKSVIDQSGGKIKFESEKNKGTTFFITLPLKGMNKKAGSKKLD